MNKSCLTSKSCFPSVEEVEFQTVSPCLSIEPENKNKEDTSAAAPQKKSNLKSVGLWIVLGLLGLGLIALLIYFLTKPKTTTATSTAAATPGSSPIALSFTVVPKMKHPWLGTGSQSGFSINGEEGGTLNLQRNTPYMFHYDAGTGGDALYFTSSTTGGDLSNQLPSAASASSPIQPGESRTVTFDASYPSTFYYQSSANPSMGGVIHLSP
jgi:hypothetical protein